MFPNFVRPRVRASFMEHGWGWVSARALTSSSASSPVVGAGLVSLALVQHSLTLQQMPMRFDLCFQLLDLLLYLPLDLFITYDSCLQSCDLLLQLAEPLVHLQSPPTCPLVGGGVHAAIFEGRRRTRRSLGARALRR